MPLALRTTDTDQLARFYRERLGLPDPVADLDTTGFQTIGGTVADIAGTPTTLTVYRGPTGTIVCRRFRAGALTLPSGGQEIGGAQYFEVDGVAVRIQQFGDTVCCMASTLSVDALAAVFGAPTAHQHPE